MAMMNVLVDDRSLRAVLASAQRQLRDMTPVMRAMGRQLESNIHVRFDTKTAPDGRPWAPWAASTAAARGREGRGTLLEYTGRMRASLAFTADKDGLEIGFGVPYAAAHEFGARRMPARPILFDNNNLGADDLADVLAVATKELRKQLGAGGGR